MTLDTVTAANRGQLKLEHDPTPRDFRNFQDTPRDLEADFRYQGYPGKAFESPRQKVTGEVTTPAPEKRFPQAGWFDARNARVNGHQPQGLQYGSEGLPQTTQEPKPARDPFHERTVGSILPGMGPVVMGSAEIKKHQRLQVEVENDVKHAREQKLLSQIQREQEKKQDLEMLKSYNPWGKPGNGAPRTTQTKKQKFTEEEVESPRMNSDYVEEYGDFHAQFGRPGAGAPLRTNSGKLKTEIKADTDLRFQKTQKAQQVFEHEVRYKATPQTKEKYAKDLDFQIQERSLQLKEQRIQDLKRELETIKHDPYGKPGAGAPNRSRSGSKGILGKTTTLTRDIVELRRTEKSRPKSWAFHKTNAHGKENQSDTCAQLESVPDPYQGKTSYGEEAPYDPWGKGGGQARRDQTGEVMRYKFSESKERGVPTQNTPRSENGNSLEFGAGPGGAGAPIRTDSGRIKTRMPITMKRNEKGDSTFRESAPRPFTNDPEYAIYDPWGRGGYGAPLKDSQGNTVANIHGKMNSNRTPSPQRKLGAKVYLNELQRGMEEQRHHRQVEQQEKYNYGEDLVTVMNKGQVGRPRRDQDTGLLTNQHLPQSDITKQGNVSPTRHTSQPNQYHTELERAAVERKRAQVLEKSRERNEAVHHQEAMNEFWGRPGGGAPLPKGAKKGQLDDMIYSPRKEAPYYNKQGYDDGHTPRQGYVRSTAGSTHANHYQVQSNNSRPQPKRDYNLSAPYANNPEEVY